ncbi:MAG TPA: heterodisulfide reductase-related iron-sulfur binding cluster [Bryobacteraceae bacterium]|nr:heterodisulfide reductase-related iron-sulfur binding cluster [Bryobacteraceae bacterium]
MAVSEPVAHRDAPQQVDLDKCVHCGLCLNACPTYRELGLETDSPRGRIYQMVQVASGKVEITPEYITHIDLCLACRGCESACPSGVQYGRLVEAARAHIEHNIERPWHVRLLRSAVFDGLLPSRAALRFTGAALFAYQASGLQRIVRSSGLLKLMGKMGRAEAIAPSAEMPQFYRWYGAVLPAGGTQRKRVAFLGGCMANVFFARLNEATVRVLRRAGCEVSIPEGQTCCGALHVHSGEADSARALARRNIDALLDGGFDAIITNAAGCGSTLKEYGELLERDPQYSDRAHRFSALMKDVNEFLAELGVDSASMQAVNMRVTYQDSCHLAHGQKVRTAPRKLLGSIPGLQFVEMPGADICCGSAGIYNIVQDEMAASILTRKMMNVNLVKPDVIATANPGCMLQLRSGVERYGNGQPVMHVVELLDQAWSHLPPLSPRV